MTDMVLIIRDDLNRVTFDSRLATAGVCLGIYHVPFEGATFNFPDYASHQGLTLNLAGGGSVASNAGNLNNGWLQFVFPYGSGPLDVALFAR